MLRSGRCRVLAHLILELLVLASGEMRLHDHVMEERPAHLVSNRRRIPEHQSHSCPVGGSTDRWMHCTTRQQELRDPLQVRHDIRVPSYGMRRKTRSVWSKGKEWSELRHLVICARWRSSTCFARFSRRPPFRNALFAHSITYHLTFQFNLSNTYLFCALAHAYDHDYTYREPSSKATHPARNPRHSAARRSSISTSRH